MRKRQGLAHRLVKRSVKLGIRGGFRTSQFAGRSIHRSTRAVVHRVSGVQKFTFTASETNRQLAMVLQRLEEAIRERDRHIASLEKTISELKANR